MKLLERLCAIPSPSGSEEPMKNFLLKYFREHGKTWKVKPKIFEGPGFQNCFVVAFGKPRTAVFVHMDTVGFTVRYDHQLLPIGSPEAENGTVLTGKDEWGEIECALDIDHAGNAYYKFPRVIARGTSLTYKPDFRKKGNFIQSPYLDNRLGIYCALQLAEKMKDGILVFTCWEEHGGGSVPYLAKFMHEKWGIHQALICDTTWITDGILPGKGVAISMRDRNIPRKSFIDHIINIALKAGIDFQLEVEGMGSSDGRELQTSPYPIDWCFVGAPHQYPHTPDEKVHQHDLLTMIKLYEILLEKM